MPASQLRVTLPGAEGSADASRALKVLTRVVELLETADRADAGQRPTTWGIADLRMGSVVMTTAPTTAAPAEYVDRLFALIVDGLAEAEAREGIPDSWDPDVAERGAELAHLLSADPRQALLVEALDGGTVVRRAVVTRAAERHLRQGISVSATSIGSVVGRLDSASYSRHEAGLKPEDGSARVAVRFSTEHVDIVREAWGKRVEVSGLLSHDSADRIVRVRMRRIDVLAEEHPPLTDLVGLDPDFLGGMDPDDYLREIRGAA